MLAGLNVCHIFYFGFTVSQSITWHRTPPSGTLSGPVEQGQVYLFKP